MTFVDASDHGFLDRKWSAILNSSGSPYAARTVVDVDGVQHSVLLARAILGAFKGEEVDHADRDTVNNRRKNIRTCTPSQNCLNKPRRPHSKQPYKGVRVHPDGRITARISINKKIVHLGTFRTAEDARDAYNAAGREHHGAFFRES